ncbi:MAG: hypothetical protein JXQ84_07540 [Rhodospirillaceae bacterium]|nr:hypothetical protein [Rhodospirillaceae bacterium]
MNVRLVSVALVGVWVAACASAAVAAEAQKTRPAKRGSAMSAECGWTGKRIIQLLSRDDVVTAGEFRQFYVAFGCSEAHLSAAFGCAIEGTSGPESCASRPECVDLCWASPSASTLDKALPAAPKVLKPTVSPAVKTKTQPSLPPKKPTEARPLTMPSGPYDKKK